MDGTLQSGLPFDLKIANLATDSKILEVAQEYASQILNADPELSSIPNQMLITRFNQLKKKKDTVKLERDKLKIIYNLPFTNLLFEETVFSFFARFY
jgi:RecG-like helicase